MTREDLDKLCETLPKGTSKHVPIDVDVVEVRAKALLVEFRRGIQVKKIWIPKSALASHYRGVTFGYCLALKSSWINFKKLWDIV